MEYAAESGVGSWIMGNRGLARIETGEDSRKAFMADIVKFAEGRRQRRL